MRVKGGGKGAGRGCGLEVRGGVEERRRCVILSNSRSCCSVILSLKLPLPPHLNDHRQIIQIKPITRIAVTCDQLIVTIEHKRGLKIFDEIYLI